MRLSGGCMLPTDPHMAAGMISRVVAGLDGLRNRVPERVEGEEELGSHGEITQDEITYEDTTNRPGQFN